MEQSQAVFLVFFVGSLSVAFAVGGRDERIAGFGFLAAGLFTPLALGHEYGELEVGVLLIDSGLLLLLGTIAMRSDRYWPLFATGFLLTGVLLHLLQLMFPSMKPDTYADLTTVWAYPTQLSLVIGTLVEARQSKSSA